MKDIVFMHLSRYVKHTHICVWLLLYYASSPTCMTHPPAVHKSHFQKSMFVPPRNSCLFRKLFYELTRETKKGRDTSFIKQA